MQLSTKQQISNIGILGCFMAGIHLLIMLWASLIENQVILKASLFALIASTVLIMVGVVGNTLVMSHHDKPPEPPEILNVPGHNSMVESGTAYANTAMTVTLKCECGHKLAEYSSFDLDFGSGFSEAHKAMRRHQYRNSYPLVEILKDV